MLIGINATAASRRPRTGVEEYTYQLIKHLTMLEETRRHRFVLYSNKQLTINNKQLPENFKVRQLKWPLPMWTQVRLASEMLFYKPDVLFIPVHVLPTAHPKNSVVTIHGLEYEYYPEMYPWRHLRYLRWSTKYALEHAQKIIAVSENTKKDLIELYGGKPEKIEIVYHGVIGQGQSLRDSPASRPVPEGLSLQSPYILFIGRLEKRKNIEGLIEAFALLKEKYKIPHKLVLVGPRELLGAVPARASFERTHFHGQSLDGDQIITTGYVSEPEKWSLLKKADAFVLPSFYEGFGIPILEAQTVGCPVVTSNISSMPEVAGKGAILVEPKNIEQITEGIHKIISDSQLRKDLIAKGYQNVKRFSWQKCAQETLKILIGL